MMENGIKPKKKVEEQQKWICMRLEYTRDKFKRWHVSVSAHLLLWKARTVEAGGNAVFPGLKCITKGFFRFNVLIKAEKCQMVPVGV